MSQENVARVREGMEHFLATGEPDWAALHEDIGARSGVTVERRDAMVFEMRDLKVVRLDYFNNPTEALEAVGLEV